MGKLKRLDETIEYVYILYLWVMYEFYSMSNERPQEWQQAADQERENKMQKFNKHVTSRKKPINR